MKNHKKSSENQPSEDWGKGLLIKYPAANPDMAKASSEHLSPSLQRCIRTLALGGLALIISMGIGLIPGLPPAFSPATAFAQIPNVPEPTCTGCGRKARIEGHGPPCVPQATGTGTGKTPSMILPPVSSKSLLGLMVFQSLLSSVLNADDADASSQESAQQAAQRAELEAWLKSEQQRLYNLAKQQRAKRDVDDKADMEEIAKAMGAGFDTPMPKSDLGAAWSDTSVVDLSGYPVDKPLYVRNLKENEKPGGTPFFGTGGDSAPARQPAREIQLRTLATKNLQEMIKENRDPKILDQRLQRLEEELAETLRQAKDLQSRFNAITKDYDLYEKSVRSAAKKALMRGISLLVDGCGESLKSRWKYLRYDPDKWNRTLQAMDNISKVAMVTHKGMKYGIQAKEIYDYEMEVWKSSGTDLKKDVDFILQNLPAEIFGKYAIPYKLGKVTVNTALDIGKLSVELKDLQNSTVAYMAKQKMIDIRIRSLVKAIQETRELLAKQIGG